MRSFPGLLEVTAFFSQPARSYCSMRSKVSCEKYGTERRKKRQWWYFDLSNFFAFEACLIDGSEQFENRYHFASKFLFCNWSCTIVNNSSLEECIGIFNHCEWFYWWILKHQQKGRKRKNQPGSLANLSAMCYWPSCPKLIVRISQYWQKYVV